MKTSPFSIAAYIIGGLLAGLGIFAHALGLDPTPSIGKGRQIILLVGIGLIILPILYQRLARKIRRAKLDPLAAMTNSKGNNPAWVAVISTLIVFGLYLWFFTLGTWKTISRPGIYYGQGYQANNYYDMLANGFQSGNLYLDNTPPAELLNLLDPYDPVVRAQTPYLIDAALYDGRYYVYWGPLPALLILIVKSIGEIDANDSVFVLAFLTGSLIFKTMILFLIRRRFFGESPVWLLGLGILTSGGVGPYMSMLVEARIYEAATAGGEFFIVAGIFFALRASQKDFATRDLFFTSVLWGCAISTRAILIIPIGIMSVILILNLGNHRPLITSQTTKAILALCLPMSIFVLGQIWYNWARFQSPFEFGTYYQLTNNHLQSMYATLFSTTHIPQNLYNYLFFPFRESEHFPYIFSVRGTTTPPIFSPSPFPYFAERMSGILVTSPILLFVPISLAWAILQARPLKTDTQTHAERQQSMSLRWVIIMLASAGFAGSVPILMLFWAAVRYTGDFFALFSFLAIIGIWITFDHQAERHYIVKYLTAIVAILFSYSFAMNILLSFTTGITKFYFLNREFVIHLRSLSTTIPKLLSKLIGW